MEKIELIKGIMALGVKLDQVDGTGCLMTLDDMYSLIDKYVESVTLSDAKEITLMLIEENRELIAILKQKQKLNINWNALNWRKLNDAEISAAFAANNPNGSTTTAREKAKELRRTFGSKAELAAEEMLQLSLLFDCDKTWSKDFALNVIEELKTI